MIGRYEEPLPPECPVPGCLGIASGDCVSVDGIWCVTCDDCGHKWQVPSSPELDDLTDLIIA